MSVLQWDKVGERLYEAGVSKGVLYDESGMGFPWNGLISVDDNSDETVEPVYFDGLKVNVIRTPGDYSGVLRAYTYPEEFNEFQGLSEFANGVYLTHQPHKSFGLSYRTEIGNDVNGINHGYKLHLLYNVTAVPQQKTHKTLALEIEPTEFEWAISSVPEDVPLFRPTAHIIFDSTKINEYLLADIERILYGSEDNDPHLPSMKSLGSFIRTWRRFVITDHGDGTWSAYSPVPGAIVMWDETTFILVDAEAEWVDPPDNTTYEITSSETNEGDIWLP